MTESEAPPPAPAGGGPRWLQGPQRAVAQQANTAAPAAVGSAPASQFGGPTPGSSAELFYAKYSRNGVSPIPFGVVALAAMAAAWWAVGWAKFEAGAPDPVRSSEWWINTTSVLLPGEELRFAVYSSYRMWVAIGLLVIAAILVALWIGRIGTNLRSGQGPFGAFLPLCAFPAWWLLPITLGLTSASDRSRSEVMLRYLVAFALIVSQFLLLRWPTLNRIWRAGHLPYDVASIILWLPNLIPWSMLFLSMAWTQFIIGEDEDGTSGWHPTTSMTDAARWSSRLSGVAIIALLVVVSVMQHRGLRQDRAADAAARLH